MPELPEIAYYKKYADEALLHKKVMNLSFGSAKVLQEPQKKLEEAFKNHSFSETQQLGKYLFAKSDSNKWLVLHFGMSGKLEFSALDELSKHAIITFHFKDSTHFSFICPRKFGKVWIADSVEEFQKAHNLGSDALSISKSEFMKLIENQTGSAKSFLMDQHIIAGIGNVYTDEILFQSKIHPKTKISYLSQKEIIKIYSNISKILKKASLIIENREKAPENWLKSHRKEGASCPFCNGKIIKIQVGGRSTYFCDKYQIEKTSN